MKLEKFKQEKEQNQETIPNENMALNVMTQNDLKNQVSSKFKDQTEFIQELNSKL